MSSAVSNVTRRELNDRQVETADRVVAAGLEQIRAVGFDALTIRAVAGRAAVAPATAYTYFSSKNHLVAEIFWRQLRERPLRPEAGLTEPLDRLAAVFDDLGAFLAAEPQLAEATTTALLGSQPDVKQLRTMIGAEINDRIADALGPGAHADVLDALGLAWSGAMLQAGMGHARFAHLGARLASFARLITAARDDD